MSKWILSNHINGKSYDLTQENMNAMIADVKRLKEHNDFLSNRFLLDIETHSKDLEENSRLENQLSEANATIQSLKVKIEEYENKPECDSPCTAIINNRIAENQSLKDENKRMRKQGWSDVLKLVIKYECIPFFNNDYHSKEEFRDYLESQLHILDEALTQKAEDER